MRRALALEPLPTASVCRLRPVAGRALRGPAGWAFGPPFPRPAAAGQEAVMESWQGE
jgi:hypothetical protein